MIWIKDFVSPHECYEVFCLRQIDDVVGVSRKHMDSLDAISAHLELDHFIRPDLSLLDHTVTRNYNEELPLCVMPVLSLGDTRLGNVHRKLTMIGCLKQLRKAAAIITIHLKIECNIILGVEELVVMAFLY